MGVSNTKRPNENAARVTTYEAEDDVPLSVALVFAVSEARSCDPMELDAEGLPPLADCIDPDSLDELARSASDTWRFEFDVWNCHVTVRSDGAITVSPNPAA